MFKLSAQGFEFFSDLLASTTLTHRWVFFLTVRIALGLVQARVHIYLLQVSVDIN